MTASRAYAFDVVFDTDGSVVREGARARTYSFDEVERERAAAYAAGKEDEANRSAAETARALSQIAQSAVEIAQRHAADRRAIMAEAAGLALAAARTAAGAALDRFGETRVSAALEAAFESFVAAPRLVLRVAPQLTEARARLESIARDHGFDGAVVVRADPAVRLGDIVVDWGDGAIVHDSAEAFARIEALVAQHLAEDPES